VPGMCIFGQIRAGRNMTEKQSISPQSIIDCLKANYGIAASSLTLLPIGADMNASVYKAETQSSQSYFVKLKRRHRYDMSVAILALLQASGIQQIIPPIKTTNDELTQHINDFTLTVYPFVEGQNGFCYDLTDDQWIALGKVLRQVHEFDVPHSIKDLIRKEAYSDKWRKAVRFLDAHIDGNLTGDEAALKLQSFMKERREVIHRLVDRAEVLSQKIQEQSPEFVLCHSDIHGGNVLIDGNGSIFIVDWDDPIMAPKERDLMFIGGGVANVWNNLREEEFFYKGYGKTEINRIILAYYRHERIVEDIAEYGQALLLTPEGGDDRVEMLKQFKGMFEPNGVVDIAFKTDIDPQARLISSEKEKKAALDFRQKHFFDRLNIQDPYAWALDQKDHLHWLLYNGDQVIGYAHVQIWPAHRAALRIIVIDEQKRGYGMGKCLMAYCEEELKKKGITLLQTEASPNAYLFYKKLGYIEMPFNNPDGEPTHPNDRAMGKYL
jgi:spectinomycin phosphotransferase